MQPISLNEITHWSPWPARLLGLEAWSQPVRTPEKVEREYNLDKYARCLEFALAAPGHGPEEVKDFELGGSGSDQWLISQGDQFYLMSRNDARHRYHDLLAEVMGFALARAATVVELGCGYGYNLWRLRQRFPGPRYLGGEISAHAVELGSLLLAGDPSCSVQAFDFYQSDFGWVGTLPGPLVVFTSHAIEQVPAFGAILRSMVAAFQGRAVSVFHFEPAYSLHGPDLLGLMRRRYAQVNDYNRDLWDALQTMPRVQIRQCRPDVFGINPLNPTSILEWAPGE